MLNIPTSVKNLFKTDGVYKNFRVHFPNGEMSDITNDNVVRESVKFTESLCSQSTFKFGLAEASVLEFETVGIANMYGMTIEAGIEIDCSSLSAGDKATIAAGTWDGTWDAVNEVFAVPYGVFRVQSCPRDHQSMAHRKVTAYTINLNADGLTNIWQEKIDAMKLVEVKTIQPSIKGLINAYLYQHNPDALLSAGYSKTTYTPDPSTSTKNSFVGGVEIPVLCNGQGGTFPLNYKLVPYYASNSIPIVNSSPYTLAYYPTVHRAEWKEEARQKILEFCQTNNVTPREGSEYADISELVDALVDMMDRDRFFFSTNILVRYWGDIVGEEADYVTISENSSALVFVSKGRRKGNPSLSNGSAGLYTHTGVVIKVVNGTSTIVQEDFNFTNMDTLVTYTPTNPTAEDDMSIIFKPSGSGKNVGYGNYYTYTSVYDIEKLIQGFYELTASFVKADKKSNSSTVVRLDNSSPAAVIPENIDECWWDEYDVDPIGTVTINYKNGEEEETAEITIGSGQSRYDMTGNGVLQNLSNSDYNSIVSLINTYFAPHTGAVNFAPIELTMQGWPWMEAGDALQITAEDGTVVNSYALRIEMSGIQYLTSTITADGGQIIEEVS